MAESTVKWWRWKFKLATFWQEVDGITNMKKGTFYGHKILEETVQWWCIVWKVEYHTKALTRQWKTNINPHITWILKRVVVVSFDTKTSYVAVQEQRWNTTGSLFMHQLQNHKEVIVQLFVFLSSHHKRKGARIPVPIPGPIPVLDRYGTVPILYQYSIRYDMPIWTGMSNFFYFFKI